MNRKIKKYICAARRTMSPPRLMNIYHLLESVLSFNVPGDVVEFGSFQGNSAVLIRLIMDSFESNNKFYAFDSFEGLTAFSDKDIQLTNRKPNRLAKPTLGWLKSHQNVLLRNFKRYKLKPPEVIDGLVEQTVPSKLPDKICFAHLDLDLYNPSLHVLNCLEGRLQPGGVILMDDYDHPSFPGIKKAIYDSVLSNLSWNNLNMPAFKRSWQAYVRF
jgi:O-methyltransferase